MKIVRSLVALAVLCFYVGISLIHGPSDILIAASVLLLVLAVARFFQVAMSRSANRDAPGPGVR
jgi:hypothetical protein